MIRPRSSTTMAPTQGLGEVSPMPARARACASVMKRSSVDFEATTLFHHEGDEGSRREMCGAFAEGKTPTFGEAAELGARRWMLQGYRSNREKTHVNSLCEWDVGHNRVLLGEKGVDEVGSVE